ncbi:hypothetical protein [Candidatus Thiodiazotropha sp. LNASS1]|uniref:hypothetical protein n=1 Tax=Candidatus Thiodiazotropha sp. LNASS1 TaxID=3096260 RepID=UPI0034DE504E
MPVYKPKKRRTLQWVAMGLRGLCSLYGLWPLLLIAGLIFSPVGPYLLTDYTYERRGSYRHMLDCDYLGLRGRLQRPAHGGTCPYVVITGHDKG